MATKNTSKAPAKKAAAKKAAPKTEAAGVYGPGGEIVEQAADGTWVDQQGRRVLKPVDADGHPVS